MMQAHQGKIVADGRFVPDSMIKLPTNKRAIIIWDEEPEVGTKNQLSIRQIEVVKGFLSTVRRIKNEGFTSEDRESFEKFDSGEYKLAFKERL